MQVSFLSYLVPFEAYSFFKEKTVSLELCLGMPSTTLSVVCWDAERRGMGSQTEFGNQNFFFDLNRIKRIKGLTRLKNDYELKFLFKLLI